MNRKEYHKKWREKNKDKYLEYKKVKAAGYRKDPEKMKKYKLANHKSDLKKRGLTVDEFNKMFMDQGGYCAICGVHQQMFKKRLHVDHCHLTGKVRGLLCANCNHVLGKAKDDIGILSRSIKYLVNYKEKT